MTQRTSGPASSSARQELGSRRSLQTTTENLNRLKSQHLFLGRKRGEVTGQITAPQGLERQTGERRESRFLGQRLEAAVGTSARQENPTVIFQLLEAQGEQV